MADGGLKSCLSIRHPQSNALAFMIEVGDRDLVAAVRAGGFCCGKIDKKI
jgi:hypothetical protein